jgi:hypothetical protein
MPTFSPQGITGVSRRASIRPSCPSLAYGLQLNFVGFTRSPARVCTNDFYTDSARAKKLTSSHVSASSSPATCSGRNHQQVI